jgi:MFS family permease
MEMVIGLRFLQGVGGAMVAATGPAMVVSVFPPEKRGWALGINVASIYAGLSCGPSIGGALVTAFGWRSLFYLAVPLGVVTFLVILWKLRGDWAEARGEPFDWRGSVVYACAITSLVSGAATLAKGGWSWGLLGAGVFGLCLFVFVESRTQHPVLNVALLRRNRVFALSNLAALLNYAATFGVTFFMSLYLQYLKGMTPRQAGIVLVVQPLTQTVLSPACGRLSDRVPAEWVATAGMGLCSLGLGVAATVSAATPTWMVVAILLSLGTGFALFSSPNTSVIMGSVAPKYLGVASGLSASMRTLGMLTSMTIITVILSIFMRGHAVTPETQGAFLLCMRTALVCFSLLCAAGIGCSLGRLRGGGAGVDTSRAVGPAAGE